MTDSSDLPVLRTERLRLRPYEAKDAPELHRLFSDEQVRRYLFDDEVWPLALVEQEIETNRKLFVSEGYGQWALELLEPDRECEWGIIGFCGFRPFFDPPQLQLLYGLSPVVWGRGLATEAAREVCRFGFEQCGFDRVVAATDPPNVASVEVMKRLGMRFSRQEDTGGQPTLYYELVAEGLG